MTDRSAAKARRLADLDFGVAQRAIESLGTTIADLDHRHVYELDDAIDLHVTGKMTDRQRWALFVTLLEALGQLGVHFAPGDRFASYEEMAQWVLLAAQARGWATREDQGGLGRFLHVTVPGGAVSFGYTEAIVFTVSADRSLPKVAKLGRALLREAQALQNLG